MRRLAWAPWWLAWLLALLAGCAENPMVLKGKITQYEQQQQNLEKQVAELTRQGKTLDSDNRQLQTVLAQSQQQTKVSEDALAGVRDQLRTTSLQLAQAKAEREANEKKVQAMTASVQRQGGVTINPNNGSLQNLPAINAEVSVRRDGDVIRVELPAHRLFDAGSNRLQPGGGNLIVDAANEIARTYPDQLVGVEGHTDNDPVMGSQWRNNHDLSVARAMTVYDVLVNRTRLQGNQLFIVGHGSNHPVVSNASPEGKQRNRRVELVIYPERKSG